LETSNKTMVLKRKQYRRGALKDLQDMQQGRKRFK
jgi:hypothetical protein